MIQVLKKSIEVFIFLLIFFSSNFKFESFSIVSPHFFVTKKIECYVSKQHFDVVVFFGWNHTGRHTAKRLWHKSEKRTRLFYFVRYFIVASSLDSHNCILLGDFGELAPALFEKKRNLWINPHPLVGASFENSLRSEIERLLPFNEEQEILEKGKHFFFVGKMVIIGNIF